MKFTRAFFCVCVLLAGLSSGVSPLAAQELGSASRRATITVSGEGKASAVPDMATLSSGVVSEGKTAREALDANSGAVAQLIEAIKAAGIEARDIATSGFSVQPQYAPPKKDSNEAPHIAGYQVSNNVTVRVRDLGTLGDLLDQMVTKGANQIGGIAFDISKPEALEDTARAAAVKDARHQAGIIAEASGVRLVRVISIASEGGPRPMPRMMMASAMKAEAVPIEAGESEIRAGVTITYEIEPR